MDSRKQPARLRLTAFRESLNLSRSAFARLVDCHPSYVGLLERGKRTSPGADFTHKLEELSKDWAQGPIRTEEWLKAPHRPNVGRRSTAAQVSR